MYSFTLSYLSSSAEAAVMGPMRISDARMG